jgi:hypothetical protein
MKITFFSRARPRRFDYKPMYYDQEKEEAEERRKQIEKLGEGDAREKLRADIHRHWRTERAYTDNSYKVIRTILYLFVIILAIYLIFFTDFINNFVAFFLRK